MRRGRTRTDHEHRDTLDGDVDTEEPKSADVVGDVEHRALHVARSDLLMLTGASLRDQTLVSNPSLSFVQEIAIPWACWHHEGRGQTDEDGEEAFEEKDVAPLVNSHRSDAPFRDAGQSARSC